MLFNEIYGNYYNTMAKIIRSAIDGELNSAKMREIIGENAFSESLLEIEPAIAEQRWQLISGDYETPIMSYPEMPLSKLQLRWLKTVSLDPRIKLFDFPTEELEGVEPLFLPSDIVYFDQYSDGDPYDSEKYIAIFRTIRAAIKNKNKITVKYLTGRRMVRRGTFSPICIEYSDKEDKFRVIAAGDHGRTIINIGRIVTCKTLDEKSEESDDLKRSIRNATLILHNDRNALERALVQFAQYKKEVIRVGRNTYQICLWYDVDDETDIVIQILSFGPMITVVGCEPLLSEIKKRIKKQIELMNPA